MLFVRRGGFEEAVRAGHLYPVTILRAGREQASGRTCFPGPRAVTAVHSLSPSCDPFCLSSCPTSVPHLLTLVAVLALVCSRASALPDPCPCRTHCPEAGLRLP